MNSSEKITAKIISVAENEANEIISAAEKEAAEITEQYKKKAAAITKEAEAELFAEADSIRSRIKASSEKLSRNIMLDAKSERLDEAFEKALIKLITLPDAEYERMLSIMLVSTVKKQIEIEKRAIEQDKEEAEICTSYEVLLCEKDQKRVGAALTREASAIAKAEGKELSVSKKAASIDGGFVLRAGNIEINCSIGLIISQMRDELEGDVYRILFS